MPKITCRLFRNPFPIPCLNRTKDTHSDIAWVRTKRKVVAKDILINQAVKGRESIWPMIDSWTSSRLCGLYWCRFVKLWFRVVLMLHYFCLSGRSSPLSLPSSRCGSQILAWKRKFDGLPTHGSKSLYQWPVVRKKKIICPNINKIINFR